MSDQPSESGEQKDSHGIEWLNTFHYDCKCRCAMKSILCRKYFTLLPVGVSEWTNHIGKDKFYNPNIQNWTRLLAPAIHRFVIAPMVTL